MAEPTVIGWRAWVLHPHGVLRSLNDHSRLHPSEPMTAECRFHNHQAPDAQCTCGLYAARDLKTLRQLGYTTRMPARHWPLIFGRVFMWGAVIECEHGYKAQYVFPQTLLVPVDQWPNYQLVRDRYQGGIFNVTVKTTDL